MKDKFLQWLNLFLVANVFFVFLSFLWFAIAVIGRSTGVNLGLDLWQKLWQPVFNPAIGILMAGALLNGLISWLSKRFNQSNQL
ncbi:hypothetical protein [Phormidium sp. CCY1219]|uniref:hypothetical protein n=1 Tax=Phormidium sp. CCY1219 TaxID=2886104 RepID=UPI002D1F0B3B|nr:hypothetical protein [Phormidium sp. CCY1219]MEB3831696.1 hypothetical protein [Phormidium sp. CCY1219]